MEYRSLGRTGLKVSRFCLGSANFGHVTEEEDATRIVHRALESGINFFDTANVYSAGRSEEMIGKALKGRRDDAIIATKFCGQTGEGPNDYGASRVHIRRAVEASLRRLQTDYIDLYQIHHPDLTTPIEETLAALTDLVHQGKVLYLGTSNFPAWQLVESQFTSARRHFEHFISEQPRYNLLNRYVEKEVFPACLKYGLGTLIWSPLAMGLLSGRWKRGDTLPPNTRTFSILRDTKPDETERCLQAIERLSELAAKRGQPLSQFALSWVLSNPAVTCPIIGPRTVEQLEDCLQALDKEISNEVLAQVDEIVPPGSAKWHPQ